MSTPSSSSGTAVSSKADLQNQKLIEALIKQIPDKGLDWQKVADEMGSTQGAVRERWRRYKIANNIATTPAPDVTASPAKKTRTPKRKADTEADDDNDTGSPVKKKPATKAKTKSEPASDDETEIEVKTPAKTKTAAKPKKPSAPRGKGKAKVEDKEVAEVVDDEVDDAADAEDTKKNGTSTQDEKPNDTLENRVENDDEVMA